MSSPSTTTSDVPAALGAASYPRLSARTQRFTLGTPTTWTISPDGRRVLFLRSRSGTERTGLLWCYDVPTGQERLLADPHDLLAGDDEALPPAELARRERMRQGGAGITAYATDEAVDRVVLTLSGRIFVLDVGTTDAVEVPVAGMAVDPRLSPDGRWVAYHCDGGLHVAPASGTQTGHALAVDDSDAVTWGLSDFVHAEELGRLRSFWWAPDSQSLLVARVDESEVGLCHIADPANPAEPASPVRYPFAGAANPRTSVWHVTLDSDRSEIVTEHDTEYLVDVSWAPGTPALLTVLDRPQRAMRVLTWQPGAAVAERRTVTDECWVDVVPGVPAWWANRLLTVERDVAADTAVLVADGEPITPAGVAVHAVLSVTDDAVLLAVSEDEREVRVACLDADRRWSFLTGSHAVAAGKHAAGTTVVRVDSLESTVPTVTVTSEFGTGALLVDVVLPPLRPRPRFLRRDHADDPRVAVLLPERHDGSPLPVLLDPYGGPHSQRVSDSARAYLPSQWFAEQGFVVVVAEGPGSPGSPAWERAMCGRLAEPALDAQVRALQMLADQVGPVADLGRVAIRGWSFGGYLAALAVLERPDLVHAAVAGAPVTDWALYDTAYTERYLGTSHDHPDRYESQSLLGRAPRLERPLLIIHGLADDNVLVAHTLRLSGALLAAGRQHQVLPLSGVTHMTPQQVVAENLLLAQRDFIVAALRDQTS
jgi:dipeptidyl-peptidase-4